MSEKIFATVGTVLVMALPFLAFPWLMRWGVAAANIYSTYLDWVLR
jgi:hypothetical protein